MFEEKVKKAFLMNKGKSLEKKEILPYAEPGRPTFAREYSYSIINFAFRVFWLEEKEFYFQANEELRENCRFYIKDEDCRNDRDSFYWSIDVFCRIVEFFGAKGSIRSGVLEAETEKLFLDMAYLWCKNNSIMTRADFSENRTWHVWESENHHVQGFTTAWQLSRFLMTSEKYRDKYYDDGKLPREHYEAWNLYIQEWCRQRAKKSLFIEVANGNYAAETLKGIYNVLDFSPDPATRKLAAALLDLYWASWAEEQINGVRGGGKTRVYPHWTRVGSDGIGQWSKFYMGEEEIVSLRGNDYTVMSSTYRIPELICELALSAEERGTYEIIQRPLGLAEKGFYINPDYHVVKDWGGIVRYSYVTPKFIMGSLMTEVRPMEDWTLLSSQNRFQGVIFASHTDARIVPVPECLTSDATPVNRSYNQHYSAQRKGTLITQKIPTCEDVGAMRIFISDAGSLRDYLVEGQWIFTKTAGAYAAIRIVDGGFYEEETDKGCYLVCENQWSPVILEVAEENGKLSFEDFKKTVQKLSLEMTETGIVYRSYYGDKFNFSTDFSSVPCINGQPTIKKPAKAFDSPFIQEDWDSGEVTIRFRDKQIQLNFND